MIEGLPLLFTDRGPAVAAALQNRLEELISKDGRNARLILQERIKSHVYRLHFELESEPLVLILKCLEARIARRTELVAHRWLPAVGLVQEGPPLLTTVGTPDGQEVWHIYSDLGS